MKSMYLLRKKAFLLVLLFFTFTHTGYSQLVVNTTVTANDLINAISGQGVIITNPVLNCPTGAFGTFTGGQGNLNLTDGIILTTGDASLAVGPNSLGSTSGGPCTSSSDPQLTAIEPQANQDLCVLEFDIIPQCDTLTLNYVFASEEYPEFVNSSFNDAFGFFIWGQNPFGPNYVGQNIALLPSGTPVSIDNVSPTTNTAYYIDNTGGPDVEYDGLTVMLTASLPVVPCQTYHMKLAIADAGDCSYDSGVFLDFEGLNCPNSDVILTPLVANAVEGCVDASFEIYSDMLAGQTANIITNGTATNGTDYTIVNTVNLPAGTNTQVITVPTICEGTVEGVETVEVVIEYFICSVAVYDTVQLTISDCPDITFVTTPETCGACDGTATATVNNATLPIANYTWAPAPGGGQGTANATGLCAGNYTLTITDANGCTAQNTVTVTATGAADATITPAGPYCESDLAAIMTAVDPGGTWTASCGACINATTGSFDPAVAGPGNHTITYTITGACTDQDTEVIVVNPDQDATITPVGPFCESDPSVNLVGADPNGTWSGTGITNPVNGTFDPATAGPGVHTVTYTIANPCGDQQTTTITVNPDQDATITPVGPYCVSDPAVVLTAVDGGGVWSGPGMTGNSFDPATAGVGTHTITYTIANPCGDQQTTTITVNPNQDATITPVGPYCESDPAVVLTAVDGGGAWTGPGMTGNSFDPATAGVGTHTITYTIANPCGDQQTTTITVTPDQDATITPVGPYCESDPAVVLTAVDGGGAWTGPGMTGNSFDPATAGVGTHTITYTIANPCGDQQTTTITVDPDQDATITPAGPFCLGDPSSILTAVDAGGVWTGPGMTGNSFDPATAGVGVHTITYTIANPCGDQQTTTITVNTNFDATITPVGPYCDNDPAVVLTAVDGGGVWTGPGMTGNSFDPATAGPGVHTITYTIAGSCGDQQTTTITVDPAQDATITPVGPFCIGDPSLNLVGADPNGTWSGTGITDAVNGIFDPATAGPGTHTITYDIANPCGDQQTTTITINANFDATITPAGPYCESDPSVNLTAVDIGGTWSGTGITDPVNGTFDPATAGVGTHTITYTITGSCGDQQTTTITVDPDQDATITPVGPFCEYDPSVNLVGADPNGTWSGTGITDPVNGTFDPATAGGGTHTVTYTIAGPCGDQQTTTIVVSPNMTLTIASQSDPLCNGGADGSANINVAGGTSPFTYLWDNGQTTVNLSNVTSGNYCLTVTDAIGCTANICVTLNDPPAIVLNTSSTPANCGQPDGSVSVTIVGGTSPFIYAWEDAALLPVGNTATVNGLPAGAYTVVVTDANGCTATAIANINNIGGGTVNIVVDQHVSCFGGNDGQATATMTGGTSPYTWVWAPAPGGGQGTPTATGLLAGNYSVTVTDAVGCIASASITINEPTAVGGSAVSVDASCQGLCDGSITVTPSGGTSPYQFSNDNGVTFQGGNAFNALCAGNYDIVVEDANGCQFTFVQVVNDGPPFANATINPAGPFCESNASAVLAAADPGGTWSGTGITDAVNGIFDPATAGPGTHTITYDIANPCGDQQTIDIVVIPDDDATITPVGPYCTTDPAVTLNAVDAGGTWTGTGITNAATGDFDPATAGAGNHDITYTISGACGDQDIITIIVQDQQDATITGVGPYCESDPSVTLVAVDGGGLWAGAGIIDVNGGLFDPATAGVGTHTITYTIAGNCGDQQTTTIDVLPDADATITPAGPFCPGSPSVNLVGADPGGTWSGTGITDAVNGTFDPATAGIGIHTVTYTIAGQCGDQQTFNITIDPLFDATVIPTGPFCAGDASSNLFGLTAGGTWSGTGVIDPANGVFDPATAGPGTHTITYTIAGPCGNTGTTDILVNPMPVIDFVGDDLAGCVPHTVNFTDNSLPAGTTCTWDFGDGNASSSCGAVTHTYNTTGCFDVTLTITTADGCTSTQTLANYVCVFEIPEANFQFGPQPTTIVNSTIHFTNTSAGATTYEWDFAGLGTSTQANPTFTFPNNAPGTYEVCLIATSANGCSDTICQYVIINDEFLIYVPNTFTPDGDGVNDIFTPILNGVDPLDYTLYIFNRWGELIFESSFPQVGWDGTYKSTMSQQDVYVWKIMARDATSNEKKEFVGHVTLLK